MNRYLISALALPALFAFSSQPGSAAVSTANDASFSQEVLSSGTPVVVDFYADWCGPCRRMGPAVDHLSSQLGQVKFVRINVDASPQTAEKYRISSIPAFRVFKGGRLLGGVDGAMSEQQLSATINQALNRTAASSTGL